MNGGGDTSSTASDGSLIGVGLERLLQRHDNLGGLAARSGQQRPHRRSAARIPGSSEHRSGPDGGCRARGGC